MTEVAQVAAVVAHDMDDVTNESELNMSDKEEDTTQDEDDVAVDNAAEEKSQKKTSQTKDKESFDMNDEEGGETDKTHVNGVNHKENTADEKNGRPEAVDGEEEDTETKEDADNDINEDQSMSEVMLRKEVSEETKLYK